MVLIDNSCQFEVLVVHLFLVGTIIAYKAFRFQSFMVTGSTVQDPFINSQNNHFASLGFNIPVVIMDKLNNLDYKVSITVIIMDDTAHTAAHLNNMV